MQGNVWLPLSNPPHGIGTEQLEYLSPEDAMLQWKIEERNGKASIWWHGNEKWESLWVNLLKVDSIRKILWAVLYFEITWLRHTCDVTQLHEKHWFTWLTHFISFDCNGCDTMNNYFTFSIYQWWLLRTTITASSLIFHGIKQWA